VIKRPASSSSLSSRPFAKKTNTLSSPSRNVNNKRGLESLAAESPARVGDKGKGVMYSLGKKFGYSFAQLGRFENIKDHPGEGVKDWIIVASKFVEGTYASEISQTIDVKNKTVDYTLKNFVICRKLGYDFFLGYRNKYWGLLAGVRPQWQSATAGDFSISTTKGGFDLLRYSSPLALRAEWRPFAHFEYRIIASAWKSFFGPSEQSGVRIEFPTLPTRRYWLFVEYALQQTSCDYLSTVQGPYGGFRSWTIGLRVGSLM
jgi:hypothetical protein